MRDQTGVSTIVRSQRYDETTIYNAVRGAGGSQGWQQVGTTLYAPVVKRNWGGRYSAIEVLNTGSENTTVYAYFYEHTGAYKGYLSSTLAPNARYAFEAKYKCPYASYCSVRLYSSNGQPLATVVHEYNGSVSIGGAPSTHNIYSAGAGVAYVPQIKKNWAGQSTGISVMNTGAQATGVDITYYNRAYPYETYSQRIEDLDPWTVTTVYNPTELPSTFLGSAVVEADQNRPVAVLVYEAGGGRYKCTNAFLTGHDVLYVPEVYNYKDSGGKTTGLVVQNTGNYATNITVTYYNVLGTQVGSPKVRYGIEAKRSAVFTPWDVPDPGIPSNFYGSAIITSSGQPFAGLVTYRGVGSGDINATFNASAP